jgi:hypothetical protein
MEANMILSPNCNNNKNHKNNPFKLISHAKFKIQIHQQLSILTSHYM